MTGTLKHSVGDGPAVPDPQPTPDPTHDDRPNIVLLTAHDMGQFLGCYGTQAHSPTLDAVAADGALFENHFAACPTCCPSRASLNTGLQPHNNGMFGHWLGQGRVEPSVEGRGGIFPSTGWTIDEGVPTLSMYLNMRGYDTHFRGDYGQRWGEGTYEQVDRGARNVADAAEELLQETTDDDTPFFLRATTHNAHDPFSRREGGFKDDPVPGYEGPSPEEIEFPDWMPDDAFADPTPFTEAEAREDFAAFYEDVYELDHAVGRILDTLEETGQRENTVFVFTVDHGLANTLIPGGKGQNYDPGVETALLLQYPGRIDGGDRYDTLASNVDILPTLLDLVDGRTPPDLDGQSLRPLVDPRDDRTYTERDAVFFEKTYFGNYDPVRGMRTDRYRFLRNYWPGGHYHRDTAPDTEVELYDLQEDPSEQKNVAEHPAYREIRDDLYERLVDRLRADDDPIIDGPIPPRPGCFDVTD